MIDYNQLVQWLFFGIAAYSFRSWGETLKGLKQSLDDLNVKMATIITTVAFHQKSIEVLKEEIDFLRDQIRSNKD